MQNRIEKKFEELRSKGKKALITFITAGDPHLKVTEELVIGLEKEGADLIELGVPFSDPSADGPVIQASSERALKQGIVLEDILNLVHKLRARTQIPILLMGYYNNFLQFGLSRFAKEAARCGVDGFIVVDLPPEEAPEFLVHIQKYHLSLIFLLTPTADLKRIDLVKKLATGFVYYVSMTGITGAKLEGFQKIEKHLSFIKKSLNLPVCVGFGVRTAKDVEKLKRNADGVIVGSALVECLENPSIQKAKADLLRKVSELKVALNG